MLHTTPLFSKWQTSTFRPIWSVEVSLETITVGDNYFPHVTIRALQLYLNYHISHFIYKYMHAFHALLVVCELSEWKNENRLDFFHLSIPNNWSSDWHCCKACILCWGNEWMCIANMCFLNITIHKLSYIFKIPNKSLIEHGSDEGKCRK